MTSLRQQRAHTLRFDAEGLALALDVRRRERGISWRHLGREAGISPSTLTRLAQGYLPDVACLVAMLAWLGTTDLAPFLTTDPEDRR